jgi:hypothetical protein
MFHLPSLSFPLLYVVVGEHHWWKAHQIPTALLALYFPLQQTRNEQQLFFIAKIEANVRMRI